MWDEEELREEVLAEFGSNFQSYDGDNIWLEQVEAARQYSRQRSREAARLAGMKPRSVKEHGTCLDCYAPAVAERRRCQRCLDRRAKASLEAYHARGSREITEATRQAIARSAERRRSR